MMVYQTKLDGWKITDIHKTINICRTSFYRYWNRYQKDGFDGLNEMSRRPHTIHTIDKKVEQKILQTIHDKLTELKLSIELKNSLSFREDFIEITV